MWDDPPSRTLVKKHLHHPTPPRFVNINVVESCIRAISSAAMRTFGKVSSGVLGITSKNDGTAQEDLR